MEHNNTHSNSQTLTEADFPAMNRFYRANLINSLSGFKSTNLVGTVSSQGIPNLAVFSQVFHLGANPALMGMLVRPDSVPRHTLTNLLETGSFTLNHLRPEFFEAAHQTSANYEGSEFDACGFTPEFSGKLAAPYVRESTVKIGLEFRERVDLAINGTVLVIGAVVEIRFPADCLQPDGYLDLEKAGTVTGSGLDGYHVTQRLARLPYARPERKA
ncbi:MAG: flavin reductase [Ferruginibacter sp.]|nr:flavin reductase [Cytophagales bacterium]